MNVVQKYVGPFLGRGGGGQNMGNNKMLAATTGCIIGIRHIDLSRVSCTPRIYNIVYICIMSS